MKIYAQIVDTNYTHIKYLKKEKYKMSMSMNMNKCLMQKVNTMFGLQV